MAPEIDFVAQTDFHRLGKPFRFSIDFFLALSRKLHGISSTKCREIIFTAKTLVFGATDNKKKKSYMLIDTMRLL